jgi:tetrahydromethanopterin S-methyltransferase subunit F
MGTSDLREMRNGRMDPGGMGVTQAGYILGMIYTLLWMVILLILLGVGLLMLMARAVG